MNTYKGLRHYIDILSEKVTLNPDGSVPPTQTVNGVTMNAPANAIRTGSGGIVTSGNGAAVTSGTPPATPPAAAGANAPGAATGADMDAATAVPGTPVADAVAASGQPDDATGVDAAVAAQQDNSGAPPAAATNFDTMPFKQAFKTAQAQGLKQFNWKGKPYAVALASPQAGKPAAPTVGKLPMKQQAAVAAGTDPNAVNPQGMAFGGGGLEESVSFQNDEVTRLMSLVNYR